VSPTASRPTALLILATMLVLLPIVAISGPGHTAPVDFLNIIFIAAYWCLIVARHESPTFPFFWPLWVILLGSCIGLYSAPSLSTGMLTITQEVYLYVWFVTMAHFLSWSCRLTSVIVIWAAIAGTLGVLAFGDVHFGLLHGMMLEGANRAQGTFENPNMFGNYLLISFFLTWAAARARRRFLYLALPAMIAGIQATASNGALLGFLGGCGGAVAVDRRYRSRQAIGALLVVVAVGMGAVSIWRDQVQAMAIDMISAERGELAGAALKGYGERTDLWSEASDIIRRTPTGVGPGNFQILSGSVSGDYNSAHNDYLGMLVERGPLGLVGWLAFLAAIGFLLFRLSAVADRSPLALEPLCGLFAAIVAHAGVVELSHFRHVWLALALMVAALTQAMGQRVPAPETLVVSPHEPLLEGA